MIERGQKKKAIFLDRDGTIIVDKIYLNDPDAVEFLPRAIEGLKLLRDAGFEFFVATNQSGIPRGKVTIKNLHEIHRRITAKCSRHGIVIRDYYYAPYMTDSDHFSRKPNPGMLLKAAQEYNIELGESWMIGDKETDVEAGRRAGTGTVLLATDNSSANTVSQPDIVAHDLLQAAHGILNL